VSEVIEQWLMVQNMWMYMEAVFSGGDIVKQLPQEAKRFQNIDKNYMKVWRVCLCGTLSCTPPPHASAPHLSPPRRALPAAVATRRSSRRPSRRRTSSTRALAASS
jgi:hypothetical protein